ncbi:MAG: hypothetical protein CFH43_00874, partial [Proteobacteria bacterium]
MNNKLLLSNDLFNDVKSGKTVNTIRKGHRNILLGVDNISPVHREIPNSQKTGTHTISDLTVSIHMVKQTVFKKLTVDDLIQNGTKASAQTFTEDLANFLKEMQAFYPDMTEDT